MAPLMSFLEILDRRLGRATDKSTHPEPKWMVSLRESLSDSQTHPNVALFMIRLIVNAQPLFRPFALQW